MKSARVAAYWYATAIVLVASALMRGISTPHVFPWWFVGAEFGGGIAFGVLAWLLGRGASTARPLLLVLGGLVVLGAAALLVTGLGYEFAAVPAVLGVIVTATAGDLRGSAQRAGVPAVGDWAPSPAAQPAGPQPSGPRPAQPWGSRPQGRPLPPQHGTLPPQHATQPQWRAPQPPPPQHPTLPPQHGTLPPQHATMPPQHGTRPPQHPTLPPQQGTPPRRQPGYPPAPPGPRQSPPPRGAPGDPPWRRVPGPSVPALPDEPPPPAPGAAPPPADGDAAPQARARHAAQPPRDAEPRLLADPEVQWAPRRRRHARPAQTEGESDPSHQEPEEN
ncbi:MAG TPA: hypothetical protein VF053_05810 [Streptosporangiales bacterium]